MKIVELFQTFQTQEQAIEYLEKVRWRGKPVCPYCHSEDVGRHVSGDRKQQRWQCRNCTRTFAVTVGTIFHGTHVPLRDWFLLLALMLNAKKSASAYQIARDLGVRRPTVWSMMHRVRLAMANDPAESKLLHGIVEADETYVGGKPRKGNTERGSDGKKPRKTKKTPVVGVVERNGRVVARVVTHAAYQLSAMGIMDFITRFVDPNGTLLITDEYKGYDMVGGRMEHARINHSVRYVDGDTHINTAESFWALVKRAHYGSHHHYSKKYMPLYIAEASYKYNQRKVKDSFGPTLAMLVGA